MASFIKKLTLYSLWVSSLLAYLLLLNIISAQTISSNNKICGNLFPKVLGGPSADTSCN